VRTDQFLFPVIKSQEGQVIDHKISRHHGFIVLGYRDVLKICQFVFFPESQHGIQGHWRGHHNMYIAEFVNVLGDLFGFFLAVGTGGVEEHQQYGFILGQICFGKIAFPIGQQETDRGKTRKPFVRGLGTVFLGKGR